MIPVSSCISMWCSHFPKERTTFCSILGQGEDEAFSTAHASGSSNSQILSLGMWCHFNDFQKSNHNATTTLLVCCVNSFRKKHDRSFLHWEALSNPCTSPWRMRSIDGACWLGPLFALNCSAIFFNVCFQIRGWYFWGLPVFQGSSDETFWGVGLSFCHS